MKILLLILIAYLLGSIQTGLWIGKLFFHTNLREHGSGNTGTTNTFRVLGKTAGTITFLVDMFKGTLAVLLPIWLGVTEVSPLIIGFFAIIGHVFPIFAGFKGGRPLRQVLGCFLVLPHSTVFPTLGLCSNTLSNQHDFIFKCHCAIVGLITLLCFQPSISY
ncbi:MAG: glycerol-3-phosphate acyltransferase [Streptococcus sp.]